jgi:membrane-associated phospholipid phosphatase
MDSSVIRMASDYNRGLPRVVRWAHVGVAAAGLVVRPAWAWLVHPVRRHWAVPAAAALALFLVLHQWDAEILAGLRRLYERGLSGDVRREISAWQQYGALGSVVLTALLIWLLDPARRRRLLDLLCASAIGLATYTLAKMLLGRPRPEYGDPRTFLGPFGEYPIVVDEKPVLTHAWGGAAWRTSDLWSMPSSHTMAAAVLSVFLAIVYPRLKWVAVVLVAIVALGRVMTGAHWPTDVIVGAAAGYIVAYPAVKRGWGVRALDWVWIRFVDPGAEPAWKG